MVNDRIACPAHYSVITVPVPRIEPIKVPIMPIYYRPHRTCRMDAVSCAGRRRYL